MTGADLGLANPEDGPAPEGGPAAESEAAPEGPEDGPVTKKGLTVGAGVLLWTVGLGGTLTGMAFFLANPGFSSLFLFLGTCNNTFYQACIHFS